MNEPLKNKLLTTSTELTPDIWDLDLHRVTRTKEEVNHINTLFWLAKKSDIKSAVEWLKEYIIKNNYRQDILNKIDEAFEDVTQSQQNDTDVSLCRACNCMTKKINGKCGKCGALLKDISSSQSQQNNEDKGDEQ